MPDDVEYIGLKAEAWDALRGDTSDWPDRAFWLDLIRERGTPALDIGCGTGRLLLDFLQQRLDMDGLDSSDDMLAILRRKAQRAGVDVSGRVHLGRMEHLELTRRYRTIIVPSSSFQLLVDEATARVALRKFFEHLEPRGTLGMPFIVFRSAVEERWTEEATLEDGSVVRHTAWAAYDPATRLESTDDLYQVFRDGELIRSEQFVCPRATRAWTADEARALVEEASFVDVELCSKFTRSPHREEDDVFTMLARHPG